MKLAPKSEQPKGGYKHPNHLLAYGKGHRAFNIGQGYYTTNKYCVAPSHSVYDKRYLRK